MDAIAGDAISLVVAGPIGLALIALVAKLVRRKPRSMNLSEVRQRLGRLQCEREALPVSRH